MMGPVDSGAGDLATDLADSIFCSRICSLDERGASIETCTKQACNTISTNAINEFY